MMQRKIDERISLSGEQMLKFYLLNIPDLTH